MMWEETWSRLDPAAGRLQPRTSRRLALALLVLIVLAETGVVVWISGLAAPRVRIALNAGTSAGVRIRQSFEYTVELENQGWLPVTVTGWGSDHPGLRLDTTGQQVPFTLGPGESEPVRVGYQITDCGAVTNEPASLPVRVERFWGTQTVYVDLDRQLRPEFSGIWTDELPLEWNKYYSELACTYLTSPVPVRAPGEL